MANEYDKITEATGQNATQMKERLVGQQHKLGQRMETLQTDELKSLATTLASRWKAELEYQVKSTELRDCWLGRPPRIGKAAGHVWENAFLPGFSAAKLC